MIIEHMVTTYLLLYTGPSAGTSYTGVLTTIDRWAQADRIVLYPGRLGRQGKVQSAILRPD